MSDMHCNLLIAKRFSLFSEEMFCTAAMKKFDAAIKHFTVIEDIVR